MPTNLEDQIMIVLRSLGSSERPATFNDLARRFGVSAPLISTVARQLVDKGLARPSYVEVSGVASMRGLFPVATPAAEPAPAAKPAPPTADVPA